MRWRKRGLELGPGLPAQFGHLSRIRFVAGGALLDPNVERILSLRPDLVVLYGTQTDLRTQMERAAVPYYSYVHRGLPDITQTIRSLGAMSQSRIERSSIGDLPSPRTSNW